MKTYVLKALVVAVMGFSVCSCSKVQPEDIEKEVASGVVLIQNRSYYEVVLSNGESLFFNGFDDDGDITGLKFEKDSVEMKTSYGTGFFVTSTGRIATNAHVVSNMLSDKDIRRSVSDVVSVLRTLVSVAYNEHKKNYEEAESYRLYALLSDDVSPDEYESYCAAVENLKQQMEEADEYRQALRDLHASESEIKYHNEVSVAFNESFVTSASDFKPCVVLKSDQEHDVALIQLKDPVTPNGKFVFEVSDKDPLDEYDWVESLDKKWGDDKNGKLFMVGFNLGPQLALTDEGLKSQFTSGSVSQKQGEKIMYTIPALPGSSGSPVINGKKQLVAINFAGLSGAQNFNYGIRTKYLRNLLDSQ